MLILVADVSSQMRYARVSIVRQHNPVTGWAGISLQDETRNADAPFAGKQKYRALNRALGTRTPGMKVGPVGTPTCLFVINKKSTVDSQGISVQPLSPFFSSTVHFVFGEAEMKKKPKTIKHGTVKKIIKSHDPSMPEKAEVEVHEADELYKEIRIDNVLEGEGGKKVKLKQHAHVDITFEAEPNETIPHLDGKAKH